MPDAAANYPGEFTVAAAGENPVRYVLAEDLLACRGAPAGSQVVATLEDGAISICRSDTPGDSAGQTAVYRLGSSGPPAVPTGRVFVRFRESVSLAEHRAEIESAGFRIETVLSYAPQAGWLTAASGEIPDALTTFQRLEEIPGVECVEPQMLSPPSHRG
jgi:hypothetical protein